MAIYDANDIGTMAEEEASKAGISPELYRKLILSGEWHDQPTIDTSAVSKKGARGPAQIIDATWKGLIKNGAVPPDADINDARTNLRAGAMVLKENLVRRGDNQAAAATDFNAGLEAGDAVHRGEMPPAKETRDYLARMGLGPQTPWLPNKDPNTPTSLVLARRSTKGGTPEDHAAANTELQALIESNRVSTELFKEALFGGATQLQVASTAANSYGDSAAEASNIQGSIDIAKLLQTQVINSTLSASVRDPDSAIVAAQKQRAEAFVTMNALRPVIEAEDKVQIWDDPLRWIANQFTLPTLKKEYNQANRRNATAVKFMSDTQALAKAQQEIDPAVVIDEMGRLAATKGAALKFKALEEASKLHAQSNEYIARALQQDIVFHDRSWEQKVQLSRLHQDSLSYTRQKEVDAKATAEEKRLAGVVDVISSKLNSIGMPSIDVPTLKTLGPKRAGALIDWAQIGPLGNGPGESMANIREFGSDQAVAQKDPVLFRFINGLISSHEYKVKSDAKQMDPKFQQLSGQEQRERVVQELYHQQRAAVEGPNADNSSLPASNPYRLVHLNSPSIPGVKDNIFAQDVTTIAAASSDKHTVTDKDMLLAFQGKVEAEPGKANEFAAALAAYYQKATDYQWSHGGAMMTGYPRFQKYGVADPYGSKTPINTMNALELESWVTRRLAAKLAATRVPANNSVWGYQEQAVADMATPFGDPLGINK